MLPTRKLRRYIEELIYMFIPKGAREICITKFDNLHKEKNAWRALSQEHHFKLVHRDVTLLSRGSLRSERHCRDSLLDRNGTDFPAQ